MLTSTSTNVATQRTRCTARLIARNPQQNRSFKASYWLILNQHFEKIQHVLFLLHRKTKILQIATTPFYQQQNYARRRVERTLLLKKPFETDVPRSTDRTSSITGTHTSEVAQKVVSYRHKFLIQIQDLHDSLDDTHLHLRKASLQVTSLYRYPYAHTDPNWLFAGHYYGSQPHNKIVASIKSRFVTSKAQFSSGSSHQQESHLTPWCHPATFPRRFSK